MDALKKRNLWNPDKFSVFIDGGVRRAGDVLKAVALGVSRRFARTAIVLTPMSDVAFTGRPKLSVSWFDWSYRAIASTCPQCSERSLNCSLCSGIGRPFIYAYSAYGHEGTIKAIQVLKDEMEMNMRLIVSSLCV